MYAKIVGAGEYSGVTIELLERGKRVYYRIYDETTRFHNVPVHDVHAPYSFMDYYKNGRKMGKARIFPSVDDWPI